MSIHMMTYHPERHEYRLAEWVKILGGHVVHFSSPRESFSEEYILDNLPEGYTITETPTNTSATSVQVGGDHYKKLKIQPVEYIHANNIPFIEGCIVKYATRWRDKGGVKDLQKIKHFVDLLIELEGLDD